MRVPLIALFALSLNLGAAGAPHACEADSATFELLGQWRLTYNDARLGFEARTAPLWRRSRGTHLLLKSCSTVPKTTGRTDPARYMVRNPLVNH